MIKIVYLDMSVWHISKTLMYGFCYDYIKPKYEDKVKLCYTHTGSFIIHIKPESSYKDVANDVDKWFDAFNYDENDERALSIGKNKKVNGLFKDELGWKIMKELCGLRAKTYAFLMDHDNEKKKAKGTKIV